MPAQAEMGVDDLHLGAAELDAGPQGAPRLEARRLAQPGQRLRLDELRGPVGQDGVAVLLLEHPQAGMEMHVHARAPGRWHGPDRRRPTAAGPRRAPEARPRPVRRLRSRRQCAQGKADRRSRGSGGRCRSGSAASAPFSSGLVARAQPPAPACRYGRKPNTQPRSLDPGKPDNLGGAAQRSAGCLIPPAAKEPGGGSGARQRG